MFRTVTEPELQQLLSAEEAAKQAGEEASNQLKSKITELRNHANNPLYNHQLYEKLIDDISQLLGKGADPDTKTEQGDSLLHCLAKLMNQDVEYFGKIIVTLVTNYSAKINILDSEGKTILQRLIDRKAAPQDSAKKIEIMMKFVHHGADPNLVSPKYNETFIQFLLKYDNDDRKNDKYVAKLVNKYGATIDEQDKERFSPMNRLKRFINGLQRCPRPLWSDIEIAIEAVRQGADPNIDINGNTLIKVLCNLALPISGQYIDELIFTYNIEMDKENASKYFTHLLNNMADSIYNADIKITRRLVEMGVDPNITNSYGESLLRLLLKYNTNGINNQAIQELVNTHCVKIDPQDTHHFTPTQRLRSLISGPFAPEEAMELIRMRPVGADPHARNKKGETLFDILSREVKCLENVLCVKIDPKGKDKLFKKNREKILNVTKKEVQGKEEKLKDLQKFKEEVEKLEQRNLKEYFQNNNIFFTYVNPQQYQRTQNHTFADNLYDPLDPPVKDKMLPKKYEEELKEYEEELAGYNNRDIIFKL